MALPYHPQMGAVLVGDFKGFNEPEVNKVRPVIVVSSRLRHRNHIVAIVPISTTPPRYEVPYAYRLSKNYHPSEDDDLPCWAKCDMVLNVSRERLNQFKVGRRKWFSPHLEAQDLDGVRRAVLIGLGLDSLLFNG